MAGHTRFVNIGKQESAFSPENAQAFCEGMNYRHGGTALARPITDNPYAADPEGELRSAWNEGWQLAQGHAGTPIPDPVNCPVLVGVVPI